MKIRIITTMLFTYALSLGYAQTFELVKDINLGQEPGKPIHLTVYNDLLFFAANDDTHKEELWVTDGTEAGTYMVKDINPGNHPSFPNQLTVCNDKLFFCAGNFDHGMEVWVTDGTEEGTYMIKDINPETTFLIGGGGMYSPYYFTAYDDKLYFTSEDGVHGRELWVTDGTLEGTYMLLDIMLDYGQPDNGSHPSRLTVWNDKLYFTANDLINGNFLWVTNGTASGTNVVTEKVRFSLENGPIIVYDNMLYFQGISETMGEELWKSDGTDEGTQIVKDINPGAESSFPRNFTIANGKLFFTAMNGVNGAELWVTDGTEEGTKMVKDINPGSAHGAVSSGSINLMAYGAFGVYDNRLFFIANDGVNEVELWVSDGTEEGTDMLKDINQDPEGSSYPLRLTTFNDKLYFIASDGIGYHLWVTDGTLEGTQKVSPSFEFDHDSPLNPIEISSSQFSELQVYNGSLYFAAFYDNHGYELWKYTPGDEVNVNQIEDEKEILLFPNPVTDFIHIESPRSIQKVALYSVTGKLLNVWENPSSEIDLTGYSSGVYLIETTTREGTVVNKLVKE